MQSNNKTPLPDKASAVCVASEHRRILFLIHKAREAGRGMISVRNTMHQHTRDALLAEGFYIYEYEHKGEFRIVWGMRERMQVMLHIAAYFAPLALQMIILAISWGRVEFASLAQAVPATMLVSFVFLFSAEGRVPRALGPKGYCW